MKVGVIGAGRIGGTLATRLVALGHDVAIANSRGPETLRGLAAKIEARPVFAGVPTDVVVIDTGNYYQVRDGRIAAIEEGQLESAWVAEQLGRPVVKVFNNVLRARL
jgi:predicted dinucleotide-binding enzyme